MCLLNTNEYMIMAVTYNLHCELYVYAAKKRFQSYPELTYCIFLTKIKITQEKLPRKTSNKNEHTARIAIEQL